MTDTILENELGMFEGYNFREMSAIFPNHSAQEVVDWDHDEKGEAEFWPDGGHEGVALIFKGQSSVTCRELLELDRLLSDLSSDDDEEFVRIAHMLSMGMALEGLTAESIQDECLYLFSDSSFYEARKEAAFELFEMFWPDAYKMWDESSVPGLDFDWERFLSGPEFSTSEYSLGETRYVVVTSN